MNYRLFFILILIESLSMIVGTFSLILFFFLYFGSGAMASSEISIVIENITFSILFLIPLLYGFYKFKYTEDKHKAKSYLYAGLLVTIVSGIYFWINA